ncbi:MAG: hypothetical protein K2K96_04000 [Lachnospiraceae bacterium]|nr:hypothetical protein [Lachnospiraceae bacterium]
MVGLPSAERAGTSKTDEKVNLLHIVAKFDPARKNKEQKGDFMKSIKKIFITTTLVITLALGMALSVSAASSGKWNIRYIPNGAASVSNQTSSVVVDYYSGGYYANCTSISGTNGRSLTITSSNAGGMTAVPITTTGRSSTWKMDGCSNKPITFKVTAKSGYTCTSEGTIKINA